MVQLSYLYMTTGKTTALTRWTFVGKLMTLLFNMLPRLVIAFISRSKCLLISWAQSLSAVILEPKNIKSATVSISPPIYLLWSDGTGCHLLVFWLFSYKNKWLTYLMQGTKYGVISFTRNPTTGKLNLHGEKADQRWSDEGSLGWEETREHFLERLKCCAFWWE